MSKHTGWEREYRTHFDSIVTEYEFVRPEWLSAIFNDILSYSKLSTGKNAIEVGVGTGKATMPFLNMGYNITAVEINPQMAKYVKNRFASYSNFDVVVSSFEDAALTKNSFDLIYAASAFHWVDAELGLPKALQLLKKDGVIALFRYNEVAAVDDILYKKIRQLHNQYYDKYYEIPYKEPIRKTHNDFYNPDEIYKGFRFESLGKYGFSDVCMKFYDVTLEYSADKYIALLETMSDHRELPENIKSSFYQEIKETINNSGVNYKVDYVFQLYLGRK